MLRQHYMSGGGLDQPLMLDDDNNSNRSKEDRGGGGAASMGGVGVASGDSGDSSNNEQQQRHHQTIVLSYPEIAYSALGSKGEFMVKMGIALMQSGVCLTYLIFVPQNLSDVWHFMTGMHIPPTYLVLVMLILQIPLSWIRDIRKLTWTNLIANGLILYGLLTCIGLAFEAFAASGEKLGHRL